MNERHQLMIINDLSLNNDHHQLMTMMMASKEQRMEIGKY